MANPQRENGHTDIANEVLGALLRVNLSPYQISLILYVIRKTWGWQKKFDRISQRQIAAQTGIRAGHVCRTMKQLLYLNLLVKNDLGEIGFNKDYETWKVTSRGGAELTSNDSEKLPAEEAKLPAEERSSVGRKVTSRGRKVTSRGNKKLPAEELQKKRIQLTKETNKRKESTLAFLEHWNSHPNLPPIRTFTKERIRHLEARLQEEQFATNWKMIIEKTATCPFLTGQNDRGWRATVDWILVNETNYIKVLEGKYDDHGNKTPAGQSHGAAPRRDFDGQHSELGQTIDV